MLPRNGLTNSEFQTIASTDLNRISSIVAKIGYTDGITDGKASVFQTGFDQGYTDGLQIGLEIAKFKTFVDVLKGKSYEGNEELHKELELVDSMINLNAKSQEHFMMAQNVDKPISEIAQDQCMYTNKLLSDLKSKCPIISSFIFNHN